MQGCPLQGCRLRSRLRQVIFELGVVVKLDGGPRGEVLDAVLQLRRWRGEAGYGEGKRYAKVREDERQVREREDKVREALNALLQTRR